MMYFSHLGRVYAELGKLEHGPAIQRRSDVGCENSEGKLVRGRGPSVKSPCYRRTAMHQKSMFALGACRGPLFATLVTGRFDQQIVPRGYSLHTNFRAVELSLAQIGRLACNRMFPFVGQEVLGA